MIDDTHTTATAPIRVMVVDDHPPVREAFKQWISKRPELRFCGEASDIGGALRLLENATPDVIVIDLLLKDESGLELIKRIHARDEQIAILVWSMLDEAIYAERALRAGARGYINKEKAAEEFIVAVHRVLEGKHYLSEAIADQVLFRAMKKQNGGPSPFTVEGLSDRELEAFQWIGRGISTHEIAEKMHVSAKTVETYRARIKQKLNIRSHNELIRAAVEWALQKM